MKAIYSILFTLFSIHSKAEYWLQTAEDCDDSFFLTAYSEAPQQKSKFEREMKHKTCFTSCLVLVYFSVAEPHHFYAAQALGKNFDVGSSSVVEMLKLSFSFDSERFVLLIM
jgi:hypothetical protein